MAEVQKLFKRAVREDLPLFLCPVNLGEIYYVVGRKEGEEKARTVVKMLEELFFEMPAVDTELSLSAARLKTTHDLGYADAFAAALALQKNGELVTGDKDFKPLEKDLKIHWI